MLSKLSTMMMVCVVVLLLASTTSAIAVDVKIGNIAIVLTLPPGYCELDESKSVGEQILVSGLRNSDETIYENKTQYLIGAVECQQLKSIREGSNVVDDFVYYLTPTAAINAPRLSPFQLLPTCDELRFAGNERLVKMAQGIAPGIEEIVEGLKINEDLNIGILSYEYPACYNASLSKHETGKVLVAIDAITLIKGKIVIYYKFGPFVDADTIANMLAQSKNNLAALYAANR